MARACDVAGLFESIENLGDRRRAQAAGLSEPAGLHRPLAVEDLQAAQVVAVDPITFGRGIEEFLSRRVKLTGCRQGSRDCGIRFWRWYTACMFHDVNNTALQRPSRWARVGAAAYILWGLLHLGLGVSMAIPKIGQGAAGELEAESLMFFVCAAVFGVQAMAVGWFCNRVNDRFGFWLNLVVLGLIDAAFVVVMVVPGHVATAAGLSGPLIWIVAAVTSTVAIRRTPTPVVDSQLI